MKLRKSIKMATANETSAGGEELKETWQEGLEGSSLSIVADDSQRLCVQAGPGTGKSYCMTRRVLRFLQQKKVKPAQILAVTFTRTAATDLRRELDRALPEQYAGYDARTLHSVCNEILRTQSFFEARGRVPRMLLTVGGGNLRYEAAAMLQDLIRLGHANATQQTKKIRGFEAAWAKRQGDPVRPPVDEADVKYAADLKAWLSYHKGMLVGELVPLAYEHLSSDPQNNYRTKYRVVLVDEFQDLNKVDQEVIELLAGTSMQTVVGDIDQSIFSFRYAHPDGLNEFSNRTGVKNHRMDVSRRCPTSHLEICQQSIRQNTKRSATFPAPRPDAQAGFVYHRIWTDVHALVAGSVEFVKHVLSLGIKPGEVLVMTPARPIGVAIRRALADSDIDAISYFSDEALDTEDAQRSYTLLTLAANHYDRVALRTWLAEWKTHSNAFQYSKLREYCEKNNTEPWDALASLAAKKSSRPTGVDQLVANFERLLRKLAQVEAAKGQPLLDLLFPPSTDWADEMRALAGTYLADDVDPRQFYDLLLDAIIHPTMPTDVSHVRIMSLHKAKGLTCEASVIAGLSQGLLPRNYDPNKSDLSAQDYLEEQRRLFYVALTRSKTFMLLCRARTVDTAFALKYRMPGLASNCLASQFLTELGSTLPPATDASSFAEL
jgi:DNA helicase-2/ATP-dependent DNA helicase PcrA